MTSPSTSFSPTSLRVSWLFDGVRPPLRRAEIQWSGDRLLEVGASQAFSSVERPSPRTEAVEPWPPGLHQELADSDDLAVVPGFVNGHTHLEFSDIERPLEPATPFVDWLASVIRWRRSRGALPSDSIRRGALESLRAGVTTIADILTADWFDAEGSLVGGGTSGLVLPRLVPFCEALGLRPDQREGQLDRARAHLQKTSQKQGVLAGSGLSPHAPYSVHGELLADLVRMAVEASAPVAMHLAETRDELELLATGHGAFVEFLERLGVWHPPAFPAPMRPLDYLHVLAKAPRALVVHGNYLADDELRFLAAHPHMTLVYCPRTHAYFGHAPHPWRTLQQHGGRVILGTDSRASNPDLDLFAEAKFLAARHPEVDPAELLAMITRQAAEALFGERSDIGVLEPGRRADLVVLRLPRGGRDPWERLFDPATEVVATLSGGRWSEAQPARGPCRM